MVLQGGNSRGLHPDSAGPGILADAAVGPSLHSAERKGRMRGKVHRGWLVESAARLCRAPWRVID